VFCSSSGPVRVAVRRHGGWRLWILGPGHLLLSSVVYGVLARAEPTVPITCVTPLFALVATCPRRQRLHKHSSVDGLPLFLWMVCRQPRVSAVRLRSVRLRRREAQPRTGAARRSRAQEAGRQKGAQTLLPCRGAGHTGGSCCESVTQAGSRKVHRSCTTDARGTEGARLFRSVPVQCIRADRMLMVMGSI
jgi:hypothetical protein